MSKSNQGPKNKSRQKKVSKANARVTKADPNWRETWQQKVYVEGDAVFVNADGAIGYGISPDKGYTAASLATRPLVFHYAELAELTENHLANRLRHYFKRQNTPAELKRYVEDLHFRLSTYFDELRVYVQLKRLYSRLSVSKKIKTFKAFMHFVRKHGKPLTSLLSDSPDSAEDPLYKLADELKFENEWASDEDKSKSGVEITNNLSRKWQSIFKLTSEKEMQDYFALTASGHEEHRQQAKQLLRDIHQRHLMAGQQQAEALARDVKNALSSNYKIGTDAQGLRNHFISIVDELLENELAHPVVAATLAHPEVRIVVVHHSDISTMQVNILPFTESLFGTYDSKTNTIYLADNGPFPWRTSGFVGVNRVAPAGLHYDRMQCFFDECMHFVAQNLFNNKLNPYGNNADHQRYQAAYSQYLEFAGWYKGMLDRLSRIGHQTQLLALNEQQWFQAAATHVESFIEENELQPGPRFEFNNHQAMEAYALPEHIGTEVELPYMKGKSAVIVATVPEGSYGHAGVILQHDPLEFSSGYSLKGPLILEFLQDAAGVTELPAFYAHFNTEKREALNRLPVVKWGRHTEHMFPKLFAYYQDVIMPACQQYLDGLRTLPEKAYSLWKEFASVIGSHWDGDGYACSVSGPIFDDFRWRDDVRTDIATGEPIYTMEVWRGERIVGHADFFGIKGYCRSSDDMHDNLMETSGVLTSLFKEGKITTEIICEKLPSTVFEVLQAASINAASHGVIRGISRGVAKESFRQQQAVYYEGMFAYKMAQAYCANTDVYAAVNMAVINISQLILTNLGLLVVSSLLDKTGQYFLQVNTKKSQAPNRKGKKSQPTKINAIIGNSLLMISQHLSMLGYAYDIYQRGWLTVATSVVSGKVAEEAMVTALSYTFGR